MYVKDLVVSGLIFMSVLDPQIQEREIKAICNNKRYAIFSYHNAISKILRNASFLQGAKHSG